MFKSVVLGIIMLIFISSFISNGAAVAVNTNTWYLYQNNNQLK